MSVTENRLTKGQFNAALALKKLPLNPYITNRYLNF